MKKLGKFRATVRKEGQCLTGYGTAFESHSGEEIGLIGPTRQSLERAWSVLSIHPFDPKKIFRVSMFRTESLTSKRRR